MPVLSVDLACRSWSDLGVALIEQKGSRIACEIIRWQDPSAPPVVELALRLNTLCLERRVSVLMLDGPQAWKSDDNGLTHSRVSERELNTSAKTGLPGTVLPGTYERFVGYCLALYDALSRLGWQRLTTREQRGGMPVKILAESYPHAAWKSLGIKPLPAKRKCRVSDLAEAWAALTAVLPVTASQPPNHDQMQAIVGGLPGLALEERAEERSAGRDGESVAARSRIVGRPPAWEGGYWREGFIVLPVAPDDPLSRPRSRESG
jgi:hypothetical protein